MKYPKIETLYDRSKETFKALPDQLRLPEFGLVNKWLVTEKIDGTNVRVILTPEGGVEIRGRTDKAQFNPVVLKTLQDMFPPEKVQAAFEPTDDGTWPLVILYGEGYGEKIQSGGKYRKGQSFRLFDVRVDEWWLNWDNVTNVAQELDIYTVPFLGMIDTLPRSADDLRYLAQASEVAWCEKEDGVVVPEGIVARTDPLLFNRHRERVMWKLKFKDF